MDLSHRRLRLISACVAALVSIPTIWSSTAQADQTAAERRIATEAHVNTDSGRVAALVLGLTLSGWFASGITITYLVTRHKPKYFNWFVSGFGIMVCVGIGGLCISIAPPASYRIGGLAGFIGSIISIGLWQRLFHREMAGEDVPIITQKVKLASYLAMLLSGILSIISYPFALVALKPPHGNLSLSVISEGTTRLYISYTTYSLLAGLALSVFLAISVALKKLFRSSKD